jgi:hypothetical protein
LRLCLKTDKLEAEPHRMHSHAEHGNEKGTRREREGNEKGTRRKRKGNEKGTRREKISKTEYQNLT